MQSTLHTAGFLVPAVCLVATGYVNCNASLAVFLITAAVGFSGVALAGFMVNHLDLAPSFAGLLCRFILFVCLLILFSGLAFGRALAIKSYCAIIKKSINRQIMSCFVGTLMGITNTIATLPGFIGPTVVGALTYKNVSAVVYLHLHTVV